MSFWNQRVRSRRTNYSCLMERRKLHNRMPCRLPPSTRWRESKRMAGVIAPDIDVTESNEFVDELLSAHGAISGLEPDQYLPEGASESPGWYILILTIHAC